MIEAMRSYNGVGLAGPQIGLMQRIFVAEIRLQPAPTKNLTLKAGYYVLVNPKSSMPLKGHRDRRMFIYHLVAWSIGPGGLRSRQDVKPGIRLKVDDFLAVSLCKMDHLGGNFIDYIKDPEKLAGLAEDEQNRSVKVKPVIPMFSM
jgi:peptide deformylase